jgi:hypothetical protein
MSGISRAEWNNGAADNERIFKRAVADLLDCNDDDITNIVVSEARRRLLQATSGSTQSFRGLSASSISILYDVVLQVDSTESATDAYNAAVSKLVDSTASSCVSTCFSTLLSDAAVAEGITTASISSATIIAVSSSDIGSAVTITIDAPTASPTVEPVSDQSPLVGIVVGFCAFVLIGVALWLFYHKAYSGGLVAAKLPIKENKAELVAPSASLDGTDIVVSIGDDTTTTLLDAGKGDAGKGDAGKGEVLPSDEVSLDIPN